MRAIIALNEMGVGCRLELENGAVIIEPKGVTSVGRESEHVGGQG
jgi:hypothetical protein